MPATYEVFLDRRNPLDLKVLVQDGGGATPSNHDSIGTFEYSAKNFDGTFKEGGMNTDYPAAGDYRSYVIYNAIRGMLYHQNLADESFDDKYNERIVDMSKVTIALNINTGPRTVISEQMFFIYNADGAGSFTDISKGDISPDDLNVLDLFEDADDSDNLKVVGYYFEGDENNPVAAGSDLTMAGTVGKISISANGGITVTMDVAWDAATPLDNVVVVVSDNSNVEASATLSFSVLATPTD